MSMRTFFSIIACFILLISCRENQTREDRDILNTDENEFSPVDRNIPRENVDDQEFAEEENTGTNRTSSPNTQVNDPDREGENRNTSNALTGQFIKIGQENDSNCNCYCLNLSSTTAELCIIPGDMYINTRLQRNTDNTIDLFLVEPATRNTQGKDIPWQDFDRNNAIATIKPASNGELEFDWLGFKINGDIAVDYAILGKKTLEGTYKKK